MTWNPIDEPCDYITLAKVKSPGLADVSGASSVRRWDEREGFGISGAFSVFKGRGLAHFSVKLRLYSVEDWEGWYAFKPIVDKLPTRRGGKGKDSGVLDIWHPLLEGLDIIAVAAAEVMQPEQTDSGEWTIEIKFLEFRYPKVTLAKADAAAATPVDPVEEKIIKPLIKQMQSLSDEQ
jgi:hypothetical protein